MNECRILLVQPPFVQLNGPYPSPYYLKSFLEASGRKVTVLDHSIGLFERIFSRNGLEQIFNDAEHCNNAEHYKNASYTIERFLSEKELWLSLIERLVAFLRGKDPEWGHFLALANGCVPGGPRVDAYLEERGGDVSPDESKTFATMLLADLADFITATVDRSFSLVRYTPLMEASLNSGFRDFAAVKKNLGEDAGYIMKHFYRPMLEEEWKKLEKAGENERGEKVNPLLLGLTIPFPGCLVPALVCAESAKKYFGSAVRTVAGGGYVNTELRFLKAGEFFDYFDFISFDRGYGSLVSILEHKVMDPEGNAALDDEAAKAVFPDYGGVDFNRYIYPVDDTNPMHRLWSDGHWLKAYLAYGCYWHSCAFCDVTLDYIRNYIPVDPAALFAHLKDQAEKTGVRGIHFCDEAAPPLSLLEFALLNRDAGLPLNFWGNIRFEKDFTPDAAAILASGGLLGVSAGLEVVTEKGLQRTGKGIDLECAVSVCAAFKEAGILTHAYLIYGYWDEDEQEIIDSAEILRQFFAEGLLDSAFWHKFILTRHSRIYAEKQRGLHPRLIVKGDIGGAMDSGIFALNDLSFEGEEKFDKYGEGLDLLLKAWMAGDTETPVEEAFSFKVKAPSVSPELVAKLIDKYASARDGGKEAGKRLVFLGSIPVPRQKGKNSFLYWRWRLSDFELKTEGKEEAEKLAALLITASRGFDAAEFYISLEEISGKDNALKIRKYLWGSGLEVFPARVL